MNLNHGFAGRIFVRPSIRNTTLLPKSDKNPLRKNFFKLKTGEILSIFGTKSLLRKLRTTADECFACGTFAPFAWDDKPKSGNISLAATIQRVQI